MKLRLLFLTLVTGVVINSCDNTDQPGGETVKVAVPVVKSLAEIRSSISVTAARQTHSDGKIYVAENYLFYIAQQEGIHIFDNSDPASPQNIAFINLEGVHDIAIKGEYLYADNYVDLVVFNIAQVNNIHLAHTLSNALAFAPQYPQDVDFYDYDVPWTEGDIITGFEIQTRIMDPSAVSLEDFMSSPVANSIGGNPNAVGTGGSYARFQIKNNALYTLDSWQLNVFNITQPQSAFFDKSVHMEQWFGGGEFETLFIQKDFLFVGATNGMFVVDASNEFNPVFISGFSHATACDPVVVHENTAYITVRGGTTCGAIQDQVNVIDISDITQPTLVSTYFLDQPFGLGYLDQQLYVCCGNGGLKVFNAQNPAGLELVHSYNGNYRDVIALPSHLIAVGNNTITQFAYGPNHTLSQIGIVEF